MFLNTGLIAYFKLHFSCKQHKLIFLCGGKDSTVYRCTAPSLWGWAPPLGPRLRCCELAWVWV